MGDRKEKEIIGYYAEDGNIYCLDCILKNEEMMKREVEKAITADDVGEELYFCDGCKKEIK